MVKKKAAIVGATGYAGGEVLRLLLGHEGVEVAMVTSDSQPGKRVSEAFPNLVGMTDLVLQRFEPEAVKAAAEVVFTALPHGRSMVEVPRVYDQEHKVIDLSGDFRLEPGLYEKWYGRKHLEPDLVEKAVYGLTELDREVIASATLIANPGCYATGATLAVAAFLSNNVIKPEIIVDAVSGVSGAGRPPKEASQFCQVQDNIVAYKAGGTHQHIPEIEQSCVGVCGVPVSVSLTPHLGPFSRGILTTSYARLTKEVESEELHDILTSYYAKAPFVRVLPLGEHPQVKLVSGTNYAHVGMAVDRRTNLLVMMSAIDNLGKGAAGQAVQNMNLMLGYDEAEGLIQGAVYP